jgi:hypothetical protein
VINTSGRHGQQGLWTRAFDAKKASLVGADPAAALTKAEAKERSRLAGL